MKYVYSICAIAALLCLLCLGASAVSVVENHKHDYVSNETISLTVTNMTDGVNYSQKTTVYQYLKPGNQAEFGLNNLTWPFAHKNDMFNMTNINTTWNTVVIGHWWPPAKGGSYEEATWDGASSDIVALDGTVLKNTWNRTFNYEFDQTGTYVSHWKATPAPGATIVTSIFWINGTKLSGPVNFTQNTSVWTKNPALIDIDWYENNVLASCDWFTIDIDKSMIPTSFSSGTGSGSESYGGSSSVIGTQTTSASGGSGSGSGSAGATQTPTGPSGTVTASAPMNTPTAETTAVANAATTTAAGSPFAFVAIGALGLAVLLFAGRVRR